MDILKFLPAMKHSPVSNYGGIPGVTSWLIGTPGPKGLVRLMECSRTHEEPIVPHSHRFDFHCIVLSGCVRNVIWTPGDLGDEFQVSTLKCSDMGKYQQTLGEVSTWERCFEEFEEGTEYSMKADEVHSIFFGRDTAVLFFEGPDVRDTSIILEPFVNGEVVPTFKVEPWMFKKGGTE
jgi:hypothetical protein